MSTTFNQYLYLLVKNATIEKNLCVHFHGRIDPEMIVFIHHLLEVKLPYDLVCLSVGRSVSRSVGWSASFFGAYFAVLLAVVVY